MPGSSGCSAARGGVDAVRRDQRFAAQRRHRAAGAVGESGGDAVGILREAGQAVAGADGAFRQPRQGGRMQHALQPAAMDRVLRHLVAGVQAALFAPDLLAEAVDVDQLMRAHPHRVERRQQAEGVQLPDGMGQRIDADAEGAHLLGLLQHQAGEAAFVQRQRERQPADARTCDEDRHGRIVTSGGAVRNRRKNL
jgi:hypothetical protein